MSRKRIAVLVVVGLVLVGIAAREWLRPAAPDVAVNALESLTMPDGWIGESVSPPMTEMVLEGMIIHFPHRESVVWELSREWLHDDLTAIAEVYGYSSRLRAATGYWRWTRSWDDTTDLGYEDSEDSICPTLIQCVAQCRPDSENEPAYCWVEWRSGSQIARFSSDMDDEVMTHDDFRQVVRDLDQALSVGDGWRAPRPGSYE